MHATRYVDIFMVGANVTSWRPSSSGTSRTTLQLEYAPIPAGATSLMEKVALNAGSSKQGKARLASLVSKCVVAMGCSVPSSSVYVDR